MQSVDEAGHKPAAALRSFSRQGDAVGDDDQAAQADSSVLSDYLNREMVVVARNMSSPSTRSSGERRPTRPSHTGSKPTQQQQYEEDDQDGTNDTHATVAIAVAAKAAVEAAEQEDDENNDDHN